MTSVSRPDLDSLFTPDGRITQQGLQFILDLMDKVDARASKVAGVSENVIAMFNLEGDLKDSQLTYGDFASVFLQTLNGVSPILSAEIDSTQGPFGTGYVEWDLQHEIEDTYYSHSIVNNPDEITFLKSGAYRVSYNLTAIATGAAFRAVKSYCEIDGTQLDRSIAVGWVTDSGTGIGNTLCNSFIYNATAGEVLKVVFQDVLAHNDVNLWASSIAIDKLGQLVT